MSDHFGTLCIKGVKAVITGNGLISGGLDNDRILYFICYQKILQIYRHQLGLEILSTHFVKNTDIFQENHAIYQNNE